MKKSDYTMYYTCTHVYWFLGKYFVLCILSEGHPEKNFKHKISIFEIDFKDKRF